MRFKGIPRGVITLGFVSLFMDVSSEMIHSLLPVFLVDVLQTSALTFGLIEGVAEAATALAKLFSGVMSDWLGKRKPLLLAGYGLAAVTRPLFPLADTAQMVFIARLVDRIGKGIRGAPRDALVADLTPEGRRGAAYGLRQSLDTVGAFAGPVLAMSLMLVFTNDFRRVLWLAAIPAVASVLIIVFMVREPVMHHGNRLRSFPIRRAELRSLPGHYWIIVALAAVFTLARFSEGFLLLRAEHAGLDPAVVPLVLVLMNLVYFLSAYPFGHLADRLDRRGLLVLGIAILVVADLVLAWADRVWLVLLGAGIWGLHMGATQGLLSALIGDAAPPRLRGTAFGMFNLVSGFAILGASAIAGGFWSAIGPAATFWAGAAIAAVSGLGLLMPWSGSQEPQP